MPKSSLAVKSQLKQNAGQKDEPKIVSKQTPEMECHIRKEMKHMFNVDGLLSSDEEDISLEEDVLKEDLLKMVFEQPRTNVLDY